jgi:hypothetical protein
MKTLPNGFWVAGLMTSVAESDETLTGLPSM